MAVAAIVEDMRSVEPVAYIRAVGLRPEDSYGFLPLDLSDATSYFFLYRERPEYEQARTALSGAESVGGFDPTGMSSGQSLEMDLEDLPGGGGGLAEARIARIDQLKEMGAINEAEHRQLVSQAQGGDAGPSPGGAPAAKAAEDAPEIVVHRVYPGLRMRSSTRQLDDFMPAHREALGLCSEDVYGVYPRSTRTSSSGDSMDTEWDDFWIVYRDRPEYAAGREAWAKEMNKKGKWPAAETYPGVAEPGAAAFDGAKVEVEKERWPREKVVMRKKGTELGDELREKIGKWGYEPEDSLGLCPDFDGGRIYFAWRNR